MPVEAYREALARFNAVRSEVIATADAFSRLADLLRDHPMRISRSCADVQTACRLEELLQRFETARDAARNSFLDVPSKARDDLIPPP